MPKIISSADLRNDFNGVSTYCHEHNEPVFITRNGKGNLAVMSIEYYEKLTASIEIYNELLLGLQDVQEGKVIPADEVMKDLKSRFKK